MSLNMAGQIDEVFQSHAVIQVALRNEVVDYRQAWTEIDREEFQATVQPASLKELERLGIGGERINDTRRVYRNDGGSFNVGHDFLFFDGLWWKSVQSDNRPWRNYAKAIVVKLDASTVDGYGL